MGNVGGIFDQRPELTERLRHGPGEEAHREMAATASSPPPSRWTLRSIRATFPWLSDYTLSGVWRPLHRCKVCLRQGRLPLYSPDPDYVAKETKVLTCLQEAAQAPEAVVVLFWDEMGYFCWPEAGPDWAAAAPAGAPEAVRAGPNNRQQRLIGSLNAWTGQVGYLDNYIVGRKQVIAFYEHLNQHYAQAQRIYLIQDTWSIHQHPDVMTTLARFPRLAPVWVPTYAPWLNPLEKLWRWLRQEVLKRHRLAGEWSALHQRVRAFLDQFATGSHALLHYVGLRGEGKLAQALRAAYLPVLSVKNHQGRLC